MRAIGSEVGFVKTYFQVFSFQQLPATRRTVLALGARLGVAHGFPRVCVDAAKPTMATPIVDRVDDLPASERFFAGGDTTVRGFSLDRLGDESTISPRGFPTGGNGVVVLNSEMRVGVVGPLQAVGFVDAGNVVARASTCDLNELRAAAGFGIRYRSPVGPIRLDLGLQARSPRAVAGTPRAPQRVAHLPGAGVLRTPRVNPMAIGRGTWLAALVVAAAAGLGAQQLLDRVVARVNGSPVFLSDVRAAAGFGLIDAGARQPPRRSRWCGAGSCSAR